MESSRFRNELYRALAKALYLGTGIFLLLWFVDEILTVLLLFLLALVAFLALNPAVTWLEKRRVPRALGTLLIVAAVIGTLVGLGALVAPQVAKQTVRLSRDLPRYADQLQGRVEGWLTDHPEVGSQVPRNAEDLREFMPNIRAVLVRVGRYSLSALGILLLLLILVTTVIYALINPRPLLQGFIRAFPVPLRDQAGRAFVRGSRTVTGWIASNAIIGSIEAVAASVFLSFLGIPGALLWGLLAFFAELIPAVGGYLMALPPVLVALAVDPQKALWVALFFLVMQQTVDMAVGPITRSSQMQLHPVSLIFAVIALASAFGLAGAILAAPLVGFAKAFYEEFYLGKQGEDPQEAERVEALLERRLDVPAG